MKRGRWAAVLGSTAIVATLAATVTPASAVSTSVSNSAKTVSCSVEARTPTYTKLGNGTVVVTGAYRIACTRTNSSVTSVNLNVTVGAAELDNDVSGKLSVIDPTTELADYNPGTVTYKFGSYSYLDLTTKSFTCVNTESGDEELATKVKIGLVSGVWSSTDLSATVLSAPC